MSMKSIRLLFVPVYKKELKTYFISPIAYVILFIFNLVMGFIAYTLLGYYHLMSMRASAYPYGGFSLNPTEMLGGPIFHNMAVTSLFMLPLLTMRLFSEEKKTDTIELLFTYPLRDWDIVWGKFLAVLTIYAVMVGLSAIFFGMVEIWLNFDKRAILNAYLGLLLLGASFLAAGLFLSSLTENQIVAAVMTFGLLLLFWIISWVSELAGPRFKEFFTSLSLFEHYDNFPKGILDTRDIIFYLSFSALFLYLTLRVLASKRYRG